MNTDKIIAEAIAKDYAPKDNSQIVALKKLDNSSLLVQKFIRRQIIPASVLSGFCKTFGNMFAFHGVRDGNFKDETYKVELMKKIAADEVKNIDNLIQIFTETPNAVIVADKAWGQCLGKDLVEKLAWKKAVMEQ